MSGQGNVMNFEVVGQQNDSIGAVSIVGLPLASSVPGNGEIIQFFNIDEQLQYEKQPSTHLYVAGSASDPTPVNNLDVDLSVDLNVVGDSITRLSPTTFTFQPGLYRLTFLARYGFIQAAGATNSVTYQFYNHTASTTFGPLGQFSGFDTNTTVINGVDMEITVRFAVATNVSLRTISVTGNSPLYRNPRLNMYRIA